MSDEKVAKRDQVLAMLREGKHTREQIATTLGMSTASVSSQFTYLRWMGNYIVADAATKIVSLASETEFAAWEADRAANRKTKTTTSATSTKSPAEQYDSAKKAVEATTKQLTAWAAKLEQAEKDLAAETDNALIRELYEEASAMVTLTTIKLRRQQVKLDALPVPEPVEDVEDELSSDEMLDEENDGVIDDNDLV